ncbi:MAG TPA: 50S ribosomal protein L32 [Patescibacteria group bacterium]|nr:50S ribosomal protein L32 [Patescibacteria group bacterium]
MGVPRAHKTHGATRRRRSHLALSRSSFATCSNCGKPVRPHEVCPNCGYYRGRLVKPPKIKKKKPEK